MSKQKSQRFTLLTIVYWFLLVYIIAALVFLVVSLLGQIERVTELLLGELRPDDADYEKKLAEIQQAYRRKVTQYVLEGITFLALIILGAVYIYRATRRQLRLSRQQQNFMMTVTHELKTPIAVTRLNLETLLRRQLNADQQKKILNNTLQETERLNDMISNILLASQFDTKAYQPSKSLLDLSETAHRIVADFAHRYTDRTITAEIEEGIELYGEELLVQMLINNLIENALKYSAKDQPVHLSLQRSKQNILLTVTDLGPGIPENEKGKVFEKFYRLGNEFTRTAKGTGLGLYLCKMIAKDHHATITINDHFPHGSSFVVCFRPAEK